MKIFQVSEYISSAFDNILNDTQKQNIFNCLELLYINNNINNEILLNLLRAFLLIFENNKNHIDIYINILKSLSEEESHKLFNLFKKINFSYQMKMKESTINKIILAINDYIINNINTINNYNLLLNVYNIYDIIKLNNKLSFQNKVQLYIIIMNNNNNIIDVRQIIGMINKFI